MLDTLLLSLVSTVPPGGFAPTPPTAPTAPPPVVVQDEEEVPDKRPEVKEALERLKEHAKKRGKQDVEAVQVVDHLLQEFEKSGLKDRVSIAKGLSDCLKQKRQEKDGVRDNKLFLACATAMGRMGPESVKPLTGWIGHKTHRKDIPLQKRLILSLGKTKGEKAVRPLVDLLEDKSPTIQGAAAEALANFEELPVKERRDAFYEILKVLVAVRGQVDADVNDIIARERYDAIAAPMITTLQVLSGHDERDPHKWQRWWNKNKKKDWDKED